MLAAIILAAGKSTRMGEPKALVHFRQKSFLATVIDHFRHAGVVTIIPVLGHAAEEISRELNLSSESYVINQHYELGQFSSFQTGVRNLPPEVTGAFLALVDQPQIDSKIIRTIKESFLAHPDKIVIPTYQGKRGHPPVIPKALFEEILTTPVSQSAANVIHRHTDEIFELEVGEEKILWNINTKEDLRRLKDNVK